MNDRDIPSLDGLRAASVLLVVGGHLGLSGSAPPAFDPALRYFDGATGVRIFFVISGFLITTLLLREMAAGAADLPRFYLRRLLRLFPVQLAFIVALVALVATTALSVSTCQFATALTYTKNYGCSGWIDAHLWSLSVEEQFYLLWPFVLTRLPRRWAIAVAFALIVVSPISRAVQYGLGNRGGHFPWLTSNSDALMIGCLLAIAIGAYPPKMRAFAGCHPAAMRSAAIVALAVPVVLEHHVLLGWFTVLFGPALQALAGAYLILSLTLVRRGMLYTVLNLRAVRFVGVLSYSLYIWQQIFMSQPDVFGLARAPWLLRFPVNVVLCFAAAYLSYRLIELPANAVRRRLTPKRAGIASVPLA